MQREHHLVRSVAIAVLLALAGLLVLARQARAGSYVVTECGSVSQGAPDATWERSSDHYRARSRCGSGGGLQAYHDADSSQPGVYGAWVWRAPAETVFTSVQANASLVGHAGHRARLVATPVSGPPLELGSEHPDFRVHSATGQFSRFESRLSCGGGDHCGRAADDSAHAYVRGVYLRTDDRVAPRVSLGGGTLFGDPVVRGTRTLSFEATDAGAGVRRVWTEANGSMLATDTRNCALAGGFATALRPCPEATGETAAIDTTAAAFATGPNAVAACAEDLALDGSANVACKPVAVWVDNACPSSSDVGGRELHAGFARGPRVRSDRSGRVTGRLVGAGAGATICVLTRDAVPGAAVLVAATGRTADDGSFSIELPPGPSRDVFVHYAIGDHVLARHGLTLRSRAVASLAVAPHAGAANGDRLRFSGTLPAPACEARLVKVQARIGTHRWQVFRTGRTGRDCAFSARYRLRFTSAARRYRFRAVVPQQDGYPYEPGRSRTVRVKVSRES